MEGAQRLWVGADPGGNAAFGMAFLREDGAFETRTVCSVAEAVDALPEMPAGIGIDAPLWWSAKAGGGRRADQKLRKRYGISSGTVQSVNSLRGAALAQALLFVERCRTKFGPVFVTETHPKALLIARYGKEPTDAAVSILKEEFALCGDWMNEHERDAVIGATIAREAFRGRWQVDLALDRDDEEQDPKSYWLAPVHYYWFEKL